MRLSGLVLGSVLTLSSIASANNIYPTRPADLLSDESGILSPSEHAAVIDAMQANISKVQYGIVLINKTDQPISIIARETMLGWHLTDSGAVVVVTLDPRHDYIQISRDISQYISSDECIDICRNTMTPLLKEHKYSEAVIAAIQHINTTIATNKEASSHYMINLLILAVIVIILILLIWAISKRASGCTPYHYDGYNGSTYGGWYNSSDYTPGDSGGSGGSSDCGSCGGDGGGGCGSGGGD